MVLLISVESSVSTSSTKVKRICLEAENLTRNFICFKFQKKIYSQESPVKVASSSSTSLLTAGFELTAKSKKHINPSLLNICT